MKFLFLQIILLGLFFQGEKYNSKVFEFSSEKSNRSCEIGTGTIDSLSFGKTTSEEILKLYGKGEVSIKKVKNIDFFPKIKYKTIKYPDKGLTFITRKKNWSKGYYLTLVEIDTKSYCKTPHGNGIGSTYNQLNQEFNELIKRKIKIDEMYDTSFTMYNNIGSIEFIDTDSTKWKEKTDFVTDLIQIHGYH